MGTLRCVIKKMKRKRTRQSIRDFCGISAKLQKGISDMSKAVEEMSAFVRDNGNLVFKNIRGKNICK